MNKKRILITGVAGMIGSHLLDELLKREDVIEVIGIDNFTYGVIDNISHNLKNNKFKFYRIDILDFESLKILGKDIDIIVHLAAVKKISEKESSIPTLNTNVKGTENILEIAKMWGSKVVFASTSDVYGISQDLPYKEDGDLVLGPSMIKRWSYAVSKLFCEQLAYGYYKDFGIPVVIIRFFGGFSPRSSFSWSGGHIPIFINSILKNEEIIIHGDGSQTRSMGFVSDLVEGTILATFSSEAIGEIINIGNDEEMSVIDSAKMIHRLAETKQDLKIKFVPMAEVFGQYKDIMRRKPDLSKARKILGFYPKINLESAIQETIQYIRNKNGK